MQISKTIKAHLALVMVNVLYGASHIVAKGIMPVHLTPSVFIFFRAVGATVLFWLTSLFFIREKVEKKDELFEFADTREAGAEKFANNAHEKGGLALLTWHHFKVKLPYYKKAASGKFDVEEAKKEFDETYRSISTDMDQIEFQREVGRLEVLGELIIKNKKTK